MSTDTKAGPPSPPGRLRSHFEGHAPSAHGPRWEELWQQSFTPWDRGHPNPALEEFLSSRQDLLGTSSVVDPKLGRQRKQALVPGCGRGYDVLLLSAFGYDAIGLEISDKALQAAREFEKTGGNGEEYVAKVEGGKGKLTWVSGDFFKGETWSGNAAGEDGQRKFDLVFDYTFLSALPPSLRPAWSGRMAEVLSPTGLLICLEWPSLKDPSDGGPPWALPPEVYRALLTRPGLELPYGEDGALVQEKLGPEAGNALLGVEHYHPKRTHSAGLGEDGTVTDWVGVWKQKPMA